MANDNWIDLLQDAETGIESLRAHFKGHAYDPHWHDSYLVGFTEHGVQQFNCRRNCYRSTAGQVFLLEPGEIHDGDALTESGFTYRMLYLDPGWLEREVGALFEEAPADCQLSVNQPLRHDPQLAQLIDNAFQAVHHRDQRIVRQSALDHLLGALTSRLHWRKRIDEQPHLPMVALRARDYLHAHLTQDIGLDDLARIAGCDRFRLSRAFKQAFGLPPHAYLIQLRLARARQLLSRGQTPVQVATDLGFADQSHMGRWFRRAYGVTPAYYRGRCLDAQPS
ncbi:MAG: RCS-specific HTH-type transcriptional activator RclR [Stenotrophomonas maltophilia]|nr:MAG: RCS-specific HTH-type transcriptional activator RclR [Stenotrophomonas maltophilia]